MFKKSLQYMLLGVLLGTSSWVMAAVREYTLNIEEKGINLTGKTVQKIHVNGQFPAPTLEFEEGDEAVIHVYNHLKNQDTSVHWHGLLLPAIMDGVPGFNQFAGIAPQGHFEYRFKIRQNGTYWYHAHSKGQEQDGLYGAFIIYPKGEMPQETTKQLQRDYIVTLSDFHETSADHILKNLKKSSEYYQNQRETIFDVFNQIKRTGLKNTWQDRSMWNRMRMLKTDLSDVTGYTFLVNGKTPEQNWTGVFKPNEKVRLRFINASAMSFFDVRIPNLKMTVVSADGQPVKPVAVDEFRIGTAETYDVIVEPTQAQYQIQAESIDRTGFAIGTLQQQGTEIKAIDMPQARPRALLSMQDMMGHATHDDHTPSSSEYVMLAMNGHEINHHMMSNAENTSMPMMNHAAVQSPNPVIGWANASTPQGHKALQYADLKSLNPQGDLRQPTREIDIHLGGVMDRYLWTMNGKKFDEATPFQVSYGERIRLKFINDSMMAHPMHLHGMFMQLENGQNLADLPNKHTVIVPPGQTVSLLLTADELGEWAIHCHLLYHMSAGMMNKLVVAKVDGQMDKQMQGQHTQHSTTQTLPKSMLQHMQPSISQNSQPNPPQNPQQEDGHHAHH